MKNFHKLLNRKLIKEEIIYFYACLMLIPLMFISVKKITILEICQIFGTISIILLVYGLFIWYKKNRTFNSPSIYFIIASYMCWFGQIVIRCLGFLKNTIIQIDLFDPLKFYKTVIFLIISFNFMFLGIIIFSQRGNLKNKIKDYTIKDENLKKSMTFVALIMILMSCFTHYYNLICNMIQVLKYGYASLYETSATSPIYNIFSSIKMFFWPGLIILCMANKNNKKLIHFVFLLAIIDIALCIISGTRSDAIMISLVFFWLYSSEFKTINLKQIIVILILGLIGAKVFTVVFDLRIMQEKSLSKILNLVLHPKTNVFINVLNEFGFNIFSLYYTMQLVPSVDNFGYGYTYFASIMAVIPSFFMGGYSFSDNAALPDWLMNRLDMDYGPGYTIVAESFYNFGYLGFTMMFFIGCVIGSVFNNNKDGDWRIIKSTIIAILLYSNIFIVRDTCLMVFRKFFYLIFLPFFAIFVLKHILDKNGSKKIDMFIYRMSTFVQKNIDKLIKDKKNIFNRNALLVVQSDPNYIGIIINHINELREKGYKVDLIVDDQNAKIKNENFILLNSNNKIISFFKNLKMLKKVIKSNKYSLIESYGYGTIYTSRLYNAIYNEKNIKTIYINFENDFDKKSKFKQFIMVEIERYLSRFTDKALIENKLFYDRLSSAIFCELLHINRDNLEMSEKV